MASLFKLTKAVLNYHHLPHCILILLCEYNIFIYLTQGFVSENVSRQTYLIRDITLVMDQAVILYTMCTK